MEKLNRFLLPGAGGHRVSPHPKDIYALRGSEHKPVVLDPRTTSMELGTCQSSGNRGKGARSGPAGNLVLRMGNQRPERRSDLTKVTVLGNHRIIHGIIAARTKGIQDKGSDLHV